MPPSKGLSKGAEKALKRFEEILPYHTNFMTLARERYRAYEGLMNTRSDAASWESQLHPPYVKKIIETTLSGLIDDKLRFRVKPKPRFYNDEQEALAARLGAEAHEILMRYQLQQDRFHEKQRALVLQNLILGMSVAKTFWKSDVRRRMTRKWADVGLELGLPPGTLYDFRDLPETERYYDGPCTEVVNLEDFFWHEAAVELQRSPIIGHRVWMTFEELKNAEKGDQYKNVDELKESRDFSDENQGAFDLDDRKRTKDMCEVLELWWLDASGIKTCTLGNRKVELKATRDNPFWHGEYPFVECLTHPKLFKVLGNSTVGNIAHLQEAVWDFENQTADNTRLINNFIIGVNTSLVPDPDAMEYGPGERWEVEGPLDEAIQTYQPNTITAQVALPYIQMLQNDMQNLSEGNPFTTTSEAGRQGSDTATEAALVSNLAQASHKQMRRQLNYAYERIGQQRLELNKQFIMRPVVIEVLGVDQQWEQKTIIPQLLEGCHLFDLEPMEESLMRQERRAEANTLAQVAAQLFPLLLQSDTPINMGAVAEFLFKQYTDDPKQFFSEPKPQPQMGPPGGGGMAGMAPPQAPQQMNGGGMTAPEAINPVNSPSNAASISPMTMLQRAMAQQGGVNNAPAY